MGMRSAASLFTALFYAKVRVSCSANSSAAFVVSEIGKVTRAADSSTTATNLTKRFMTTAATTVDPEYPGTAVERMTAARERVRQLDLGKKLVDEPWENIRRDILWAGGLRDLPNARPGYGYTGHSFNDYNHVDLTAMLDLVSDNENDGSVEGIAIGNRLGSGIRIASLEDLGPGGSWSTCALGCNKDPPQDVAHIQFRSRIAFKLVWAPTKNFDSFVLVDDDGKLLAKGKPLPEGLPAVRERQLNYQIVQGSKYAVEADKLASQTVIK